jgi:hypothetical protein
MVVVILILVSIVVTSTRGEARPASVRVEVIEEDPIPINSPAPGRFISKGESECRRVLERIYGVPFPSTWPEWLRSTETGRKLEIDCFAEIPYSVIGLAYNGKVAIGCEYQGQQHYNYVASMQKDERAYQSQQWNDEFKRRICEARGVHLIEVPYTITIPHIKEFIVNALRSRNLLPVGYQG